MTKITNKNSKKKQVPKLNINMFLKKLPSVKINRRKDDFVKILKGNCYLKDVYYGIQVLENFHGAPGRVIGKIQNQKDMNQWIKTINHNILNYKPPSSKSNRVLSPDDKVEIMIRVSTRDRLKTLKHKKETYDIAINRALNALVK